MPYDGICPFCGFLDCNGRCLEDTDYDYDADLEAPHGEGDVISE